ncbi:MAG: VOC family protein [bacterium]
MRKELLAISIFIALIIGGCSSKPEFPSINYSSSKQYDNGQVVWRDLVTANPKLAAEFYKNVFGWTSSQVVTGDQPYWIFKSNGKPVAGMYLMTDGKKKAGGEWVPYFSVSSLEDFIKKSRTGGSNLIVKPVELEGRGNVALLTDPQGAYFAIIKSSNGDPVRTDPPEFDFLWNELWSNDIQKSADFYKMIFNSQVEDKKDDERPYIILKNNGKLSSGIIKNPVEDVRNNWVQYIRVSDVKKTEQKVKDAGGNVIIPVDSTIRNGTVSVFLDPTGAAIAIQKWPIK